MEDEGELVTWVGSISRRDAQAERKRREEETRQRLQRAAGATESGYGGDGVWGRNSGGRRCGCTGIHCRTTPEGCAWSRQMKVDGFDDDIRRGRCLSKC